MRVAIARGDERGGGRPSNSRVTVNQEGLDRVPLFEEGHELRDVLCGRHDDSRRRRVGVVEREPKMPAAVPGAQLREWNARIEDADDASGPSSDH